ncbi:hypothetical protein BJY04DRAFT_210610 [Aspergillus karnatakaensis]|uniref:uncharacterized protein n=1 Tax=Aspergillus karnatakaensis TaxID=1810916 RepID=UPI003CCCA058
MRVGRYNETLRLVERHGEFNVDALTAAAAKSIGRRRIGTHNVVLTCLPEMGKRNAASVASNLQVSFPRVNLALLVGICGGVPFPSDRTEAILADVIISDKVVEYDSGGPARSIRSFLSGLKTRSMHDKLHDDLWKYHCTLQSHLNSQWQYPGTLQDELFEANYRHKHYYQHPNQTCVCAECYSSSDPVCEKALELDCRKLGCMGLPIPRIRLAAESPKPHVYFGPMALADTVMKSGEHRDKLAAAEKVIGFEMEGAGIWDILLCIIIKGICDYADSHKNKTTSIQTEAIPTAYVPGKSDECGESLSDGQRKELLDLLRFEQIDARQMSLKAAQGKTCRAGKSIMMKFLSQEAKKKMKGAIVVSFFFNARGDILERSTMGLYRSLLLHLLSKMPDAMPCLDHCGVDGLSAIKSAGWQPELLKEIFSLLVDRLQNCRVVCYIDALDECPEDDIRDMVSLFEELAARQKTGKFLICFSSRHYPEITIKTGLQLVLETERDHEDDISQYIDSQLKIGDTPQANAIKAEILRKSSGIFLWVALVVLMLNKEHDKGRTKGLKETLDKIPPGLHDLFLDILTRDQNSLEETILCIEFVLFAKRPLSPQELQVALLNELEDRLQDPLNTAEVTPEVLRKFILDVSKGLAEVTKSRTPTEDGITKLMNRETDIGAQSHDTITRVCLLQLKAYLGSEADRPQEPYISTAKGFSEHSKSQFPFWKYAVTQVLYHANAAQRLGAPQTSLMARFKTKKWIMHYNTLQRHDAHLIRSDTHLLYLLAAQGADALIRIHPERSDHLSLRGGPFRYPLLAALYSGNSDAARALLGIDTSQNANSDAPQQESPFTLTKMKVEKGTKQSRNLISYLSEFGDTVLLRRMLETGEYKQCDHDRHVVEVDCMSPLHYASSEGVLEVLLEFAQDLGLLANLDRDALTLIDIAVNDASSKTDVVLQVLEFWPDTLKQPFLAYAATKGFVHLANIAIQDAGHSVDEVNPRGKSLYSLAALGRTNHTGRLAIMKCLHDANANPGTPDLDGRTPLHHAVLTPRNEEIIKFLISTGKVELDHRDCHGQTALALAVLGSRKRYVQTLLAAGADPTTRLLDGSTMFIYSVKMSRCEYDASDSNGRTALSWCATVGDEVAVRMMRDNEDRTALERAIHGGRHSMNREE